jgi:hypothetical protein
MPNSPADALRARILALTALTEQPGWRLLTADIATKRANRLEALRQRGDDWTRGLLAGEIKAMDDAAKWPEGEIALAEAKLKEMESHDEPDAAL